MFEKEVNQFKVHYLFKTDHSSISTYYKMKCKNGASFSEREKTEFVTSVINQLNEYLSCNQFDLILVPDTTNVCFLEILTSLNKDYLILKKRAKAQILKDLESQKMMKAERAKLFKTIEDMPELKIGLIAANQRQRVANLLFEQTAVKIEPQCKILYLDDSVFTGSTFCAVKEVYPLSDAVVLFSD